MTQSKSSVRLMHVLLVLLTVSTFSLASIQTAHANPAATECAKRSAEFLAKKYKGKGFFTEAGELLREKVVSAFRKAHQGGQLAKKLDSKMVKALKKKHLDVDLDAMAREEINALHQIGMKKMTGLHVVTSAAGLWSRGGGAVKAVIPYNLKDLIFEELVKKMEKELGKSELDTTELASLKAKSEEMFARITHLGKIVKTEDPQDTLKLAGVDGTKYNADEAKKHADDILARSSSELLATLAKYERDPKAINALDLKFVQQAINSKEADTYVSMDIWTSEQTHDTVANYVKWLQKNYRKKTFSPDPNTDREIKDAMESYFKMAKDSGDTFLFGYQEGLHAIDPKYMDYDESSASIGEGAGAIIDYLEKSGRANQLFKRGKEDIVFENIEVVSPDLGSLYAAYKETDNPVGIVLVPQKPGYVGGSPFLIRQADGSWDPQLIEQSVLDDKFKEGNEYFNTNTIFLSLTNLKKVDSIGFEKKSQKGKTIYRVKFNIGDFTFTNATTVIGGRVGHQQGDIPADHILVEYENFKSYDDYGTNGAWYLSTFQNMWTRQLIQGRGPASARHGAAPQLPLAM